MSPQSKVYALLSDKTLRSVFSKIVENRSVLQKELVEQLSSSPDPDAAVSKDSVQAAVTQLLAAHLIKERPAPIDDFSTYYVTAEGLTAERQLRLPTSAMMLL